MAPRHARRGECEHRYSISISSIPLVLQGCTPRTDFSESVLTSKQIETKMIVRKFWIVYHTLKNNLIDFPCAIWFFFTNGSWFSTREDKKCQFMTLCLSNTLENLIWCELFLIFWECVLFLLAQHVCLLGLLIRSSFSKYAPCSFTPSNALSTCYKSERHGDQPWSGMILLTQKAHSCLPLEL